MSAKRILQPKTKTLLTVECTGSAIRTFQEKIFSLKVTGFKVESRQHFSESLFVKLYSNGS